MGLDCIKYFVDVLKSYIFDNRQLQKYPLLSNSDISLLLFPELEAVRAEGGRRGALGGPHPAQDHGPGIKSYLELDDLHF